MKDASARVTSASFRHVGFVTPSLEGSLRFWNEVMGFEAIQVTARKGDWIAPFTGVDTAEYKFAYVSCDGTVLEFLEFGQVAATDDVAMPHCAGTGHVAFAVEHLDALVERILAAGGMLVGRVTEGSGFRGVFLRDPFGLLIELVQAR